jgi:hypothetical protein
MLPEQGATLLNQKCRHERVTGSRYDDAACERADHCVEAVHTSDTTVSDMVVEFWGQLITV